MRHITRIEDDLAQIRFRIIDLECLVKALLLYLDLEPQTGMRLVPKSGVK